MRPFELSPADEIAIWFEGGGVALALFIRVPSEGGEAPRFDIFEDFGS